MKSLSLLLSVGLASTLCAQSPLTTFFTGINGGTDNGLVFFDMQAQTDITVTRIDVNTDSVAGTAGRIRVFQTIAGFPLFSGSENVPANWQLLGEADVVSAGPDVPTVGCFPVPFTIPASIGQRGYAIEHVGINARYTNGTGANQFHSTNELTLTAGSASHTVYADLGGSYPFAGNLGLFNPRVFNGSIHYTVGTSATPCSYSERVGARCGGVQDSLFDMMLTPALASGLTGRMILMNLNAAGGYTVLSLPNPGGLIDSSTHTPLTGWTTTIAGAVPTDEGEVVQPLTTPFPHPGGLATSLVIHVDGHVSESSNMAFLDTLIADDWAPTVEGLLAAPSAMWCSWHDFSVTTSGQIRFAEVGTQAIITWVGVPSLGVAGSSSTFQMVFDSSTGTVQMAWETVHPTGTPNPLYAGNPWLVGYSPGGASPRPEREFDVGSDTSPPLVNPGETAMTNTSSLVLSSAPRPVFGANVAYTVPAFPSYPNGAPYGFPFGLLHFSVANPAAPGLPLALFGVGRLGCVLNFDLGSPIGPFTFVAPGVVMSIDTAAVVPSMLGLEFWGQAAAVDVAGDLLGSLVTSNALRQRCQTN